MIRSHPLFPETFNYSHAAVTVTQLQYFEKFGSATTANVNSSVKSNKGETAIKWKGLSLTTERTPLTRMVLARAHTYTSAKVADVLLL